ncbi:protocadherin beta-16-like [Styela clava]
MQWMYIATMALLLMEGFYVVMASRTEDRVTKYVSEDEQEGFIVANMAKIFSLDYDERAGRTFKLLSQNLVTRNPTSEPLEVELLTLDKNTGVITLAKPIDREDLCESAEQCIIEVQAVMLPNRFFTMLNMDIIIEDVNDNPPIFNKKFETSVREDDVIVGDVINLDQFKATDPDIGLNGQISYKLQENSYFAVETYEDNLGISHLQFKVLKVPDHEEIQKIELKLTARDGGSDPLSNHVTAVINIEDANDQDPVFDQQEYTAHLRENDGESLLVTTVHAEDADSGDYGSVRYFIPKTSSAGKSATLASKLLSVNKLNGEVRLKRKVDREIHDGLRVLIEARDSDPEKPRVGKTWLIINVEDVNDNAPIIKVNFIVDSVNFTGYIPESDSVQTYVAYVSATDVDNGLNGQVTSTIQTYGKHKSMKDLVELHNEFNLATDGLLTTGRQLDRETFQYYIIKLKSCDGGTPAKCAVKNITIVVLDINDNSPIFDSPAKAVMIAEDNKIGSFVINVQALDQDAAYPPSLWKNKEGEIEPSRNGIIRYEIIHGNTDYFGINEVSGDIRLKKPLDHEKQKEWRLMVEARDEGWESSSRANCSIVIRVADVNDNRPVFINPDGDNAEVYSTILYDQLIMKVEAIDSDYGSNSKINYKIIKEDEKVIKPNATDPTIFIMNPINGELRLNFSNENLTDILGWHTVDIEASDSGTPPLSANILIHVKVTDENLPDPSVRYAGFDKKYILLAVVLGAASCVLIIVIACIFLCRKRKAKKDHTYNIKTAESKKRAWITAPVNLNNTPRPEHSSYFKPRSLNNPSSTSSPNRLDDVTGRDDVIVSQSSILQAQSQLKTFKADSKSAPTTVIFSSVRAADRDSGRGDSDSEAGNLGITDEQATQEQIFPVTQRQNSQQDNESTRTSELGPQCDENCRKYGHSDNCWMPSPTSDSYYPSKLRFGMTASTPQLDHPSYFDNDGIDRRKTEYPTLQHFPKSTGYYQDQPDYYRTMSPSFRQTPEQYYQHGYESELQPIEEMTPLNPPVAYPNHVNYDPDDVSAQTHLTLSTSPRHQDEATDNFARASSRSSLASSRDYSHHQHFAPQNQPRWDSRYYNPPRVQRTPIHSSQPDFQNQNFRPATSPIPRMTYPRLSSSSSENSSKLSISTSLKVPSAHRIQTSYPTSYSYYPIQDVNQGGTVSIQEAQDIVSDIDNLLLNQ